MNLEKEILRALVKIDASGETLEHAGAVIVDRKGNYLSGSLYLWSGFGDRAFVFKNAAQAKKIIDRYGLDAIAIKRG